MDTVELTISQAAELLRKKQVSAVELTQSALQRINEAEPKIHAFLKVTPERALAQAKKAQALIDRGDEASPLVGIPMAHKDVYCTAGVETTAASNILRGYIPPYSATSALRIEQAGAVMLGKLNCDAFAHGASTENSDFGPTRNPYRLDCVPGGSSGGSAAAVAAGEVVFATGTDTGGSIRHPASFTNTVGFKPTYGRVSRYGIIAMASSTDCPGPITKTVEDCAYVLQVMAGHDTHDATSSRRPVPDYASFLGKNIKGWKIGVPNEYFSAGLDREVEKLTRTAILKFEELGATIEGTSLPLQDYALAVYYIIIPSEISSNLARYDGIKYGFSVEREPGFKVDDLLEVYRKSRGKGFGAEAKRRIMLGTYALSAGYYDAYYKKAMQVRELLRRNFLQAFEKYDLLLAPVSPTPPFRVGEKVGDPLKMYLSDIYTVTINLTGNPGVSVPCGFAGDLPVGLQIIGPHFGEAKILQAGYAYEQATRFYQQKPKI
ncbi:MAG: Asp-tRNA(Asn)/Glu-tRNA(Gln) amidotransferase subunit GatA [Candidatus Doudnabacteria bacterium]|nr:Asp-tRNA(Asn)/Glu-tRNA(Gln) amidotransferase subunit GatA [Candidatus Doudnabacteria bacterium]